MAWGGMRLNKGMNWSGFKDKERLVGWPGGVVMLASIVRMKEREGLGVERGVGIASYYIDSLVR